MSETEHVVRVIAAAIIFGPFIVGMPLWFALHLAEPVGKALIAISRAFKDWERRKGWSR